MGKRLYFAHPVNVYNTPLEQAMLTLIAHCFPGYEIVNPNTPEYQRAYEKVKATSGGTHGAHKGMVVFYEILEGLSECVSMPFLDGRMGLGVAGETQKTVKSGKTAWLITPSRQLTAEDLDSFVANPLNGTFTIRLLHDDRVHALCEHSGELKDNPPSFVVGYEETRLRTFMQYGGAMRPYISAHNVSLPVPEDFYALDPKKNQS